MASGQRNGQVSSVVNRFKGEPVARPVQQKPQGTMQHKFSHTASMWSMNMAAMANLDFSALASAQIPNLGPALNLSMVMNFAMSNATCGSACPISF